jgi:hypothetical protein
LYLAGARIDVNLFCFSIAEEGFHPIEANRHEEIDGTS